MKQMVYLLSAFLLLSACSNSSVPVATTTGDVTNSEISIDEHVWTLSEFQTSDGGVFSHSNQDEFVFNLQFQTSERSAGGMQGRIIGFNACNAFSGDFTLEENRLTVFDVAQDGAFCERFQENPAGLFQQLLSNDDSRTTLFQVENQLEVLTDNNEKLVFTVQDTVAFSELRNGDLAFTEDLTFDQPRFQLLRSQASLNDLYVNALTQSCSGCLQPLLEEIDFETRSVILVAHEIVISGGFDVFINSASRSEDHVTVEVIKTSPGEACPVDDAFTGPFRLYILDGVFNTLNIIERNLPNEPCLIK